MAQYLLPGGVVVDDPALGQSLLIPGGLVLQQEEPAPTPTVSTGQAPAGRPSRKRRRKYQVEIDGQSFDVSSADEANELLRQAEELARQKANDVAERAAKASNRQRRKVLKDAGEALLAPSVRVYGSDIDPVAAAIEQQAREFASRISQMYRDVLQAIEIGAFIRRRQQEEEDDAIVMILLNL